MAFRVRGSLSLQQLDVGPGFSPSPRGVMSSPKMRTPGNRRAAIAGGNSTPSSTGLKMRTGRRHFRNPKASLRVSQDKTPGTAGGRRRLKIRQQLVKGTPRLAQRHLRNGADSPAQPSLQLLVVHPVERTQKGATQRRESRIEPCFLSSPCRPSRLIQKYLGPNHPGASKEAFCSSDKHSHWTSTPHGVRRGNSRGGTGSLEAWGASPQTFSPRNTGRVKMVYRKDSLSFTTGGQDSGVLGRAVD